MKSEASSRDAGTAGAKAALLALGIVYGDLGTSPLYTVQAIALSMGDRFAAEAALGSLSLIIWALTVTVSLKYCWFVMRADNQGEGGILALMTMTGARWAGPGRWSPGSHAGTARPSRSSSRTTRCRRRRAATCG